MDEDGTSDVLVSVSSEQDSGVFSGPIVLSGIDGTEAVKLNMFDNYSPISVGDIDGDGRIDLVGVDSEGRVCAARMDSEMIWCTPESVGTLGNAYTGATAFFSSLRIADLNGDGLTEVVSARAIIRGDTGEVIYEFQGLEGSSDYSEVVVADLDGDGMQEILRNWRVYNHEGQAVHQLEPIDEELTTVVPIPVQYDDDDEAEIVWIGITGIILSEADGFEISRVLYPETEERVTPMDSCAGDITGDGRMEFFTSDMNYLYAWTLDLEILWAFPIEDDTGGVVGCSLFDFDLDGRKEIVYADAFNNYILDGEGQILFQDTSWDSKTAFEIPMVVDLDGDGSVEIIFSGFPWESRENPSVRVFTHPEGVLPPGGRFWPGDTWSGTSVWLDGTVPRQPEVPWLKYGVWRGQPEYLAYGRDLVPEVTDTCVSSCWEEVGTVSLSVRLENRGPQEARAGTPMAVYGLDEAGAYQLLEVLTLAEPLAAGWAADTEEVTIDRAQAVRGLRFVAGDDGAGTLPDDDCDRDNNILDWAQDLCAGL